VADQDETVFFGDQKLSARAYLRRFLFNDDRINERVDRLSGGERARLLLAKVLKRGGNILVLDEPTNDLDMDTLDALEDMLASYDGTVLIVSHDRAFLDGVATQIVGPVGNGKWVETPGGWSDFEREHGAARATQRRAEARAEKPSVAPAAPRKQTKLSYKDERRAAELDALIPTLAAEIAKLDAELHEPNLFATDAARFSKTAARLEMARAEHAAAESEWLEIELKREALTADE
jgi:ATP-binding cassette subfamily F protein uup